MNGNPEHRSRVIASPWKGVYATAMSSARHFNRHWHSTYGIGLLDTGAHRSASGRGEVDAFAGDLITTNPGEVHDGRPLGVRARSWRIVYVEPDVLASHATAPLEHGGPSVELTQPVLNDAGLRRALSRLLDCLERWDPRSPDARANMYSCDEALAIVCGLLLDRCSTAPTSRTACADMRQVRDRLADEFQAPPTLIDLASMVGLSRYQLLRRFRETYGATPHAWLMQQQVERARRLIAAGASASAAAAQAGFADQSHMTRLFARSFGFTPGQWRAARAQVRG